MENSIFSIDPTYFYGYFGVFVVIAIAAGVILYFILRKKEPSKVKFGSVAPVSNILPKIAAIAVSLAIIGYAYNDTWIYFHTAKIADDRLHLGYYFPERTVEISEINKLIISVAKRRFKGEKYQIRIKTPGQAEYLSQIMDADLLKINLEKLENSVNKKY
ncbi:MAG TPA: hypothetical protein ENO18_01765 [Caldithrix sp.]|nr:hypothetical protein [Caldithrix sp.]